MATNRDSFVSSFCSSTPRIRLRLGSRGGCSTSMASGVSTGEILVMKYSSSPACWASVSSSKSRGLSPASFMSGMSTFCKRLYWSSTMVPARSRMRSSCSLGERPVISGLNLPVCRSSMSPPTRTWKNSSRLLALMERNLMRSSSGSSGRSAWLSTRWLNSSQDISRLINIERAVRVELPD